MLFISLIKDGHICVIDCIFKIKVLHAVIIICISENRNGNDTEKNRISLRFHS